ncbi:RNA polymerase recycling motor HelD [Peribacillus sp. SCS-155]|uniref:RNA polymerase recycling motor HelD n=1 Tax=Peribacillus sedimenti TaxID=3115297 RepID=UPI0039057AEA
MNREEEIAYEQGRVDQVTKQIHKELSRLSEAIGEAGKDISHIRKNFWEDVTVNVENPDEIGETFTSIKQQTELLGERERRQRHSQKQLDLLSRLYRSPYFGRIDFLESSEQRADRIYIGIGSFYDEESESFLIYDWRAPISSVYYDYSIGPASYEAPFGTIEGMLQLKRQFIIRNRQIVSVFDTGVTIGDELLQEVLGKQADTQMKSIVATIQKEQNLIIRNDRKKLLIVQGAAGSGKTSAALQRVAYLLYRYRETLQSENILLFSPNPLFNSYVSNVLPELGEENMQQTTFQQYIYQMLHEDFELETLFEQTEYLLSAENGPELEERLKSIHYKSSLDFLKEIEDYIEILKKGKLVFLDIKFRGNTLVSSRDIYDHFYSFSTTLPIPNRMKLVSEWLRKQLREAEKREVKQPWVEEEIQYLDKEDYLKSYRKLGKQNTDKDESFDDFDRESMILASMLVKKRFRKLYKAIEQLAFVDIPAIYRNFFAFGMVQNQPEGWDVISSQTIGQLDQGRLSYEDATPYLFLKEQIEGFRTNTLIRHVFIDEAQDYSPFQYAFLKRLFPRSKMTVLGDINQSIFAHGTKESLYFLENLFEEGETERIELQRSYRSTMEIVKFTKELLPGGERIQPFNRRGSKPVVITTSNRAELPDAAEKAINDLREMGHDTIAVICKTAAESEEAHGKLLERLPVRLVGTGQTEFEEGVVVIPSYLAKGIEFDAVVIYDASEDVYGEESDRRLFYTACTRAMHELYICSAGEVTGFIAHVDQQLYERRDFPF